MAADFRNFSCYSFTSKEKRHPPINPAISTIRQNFTASYTSIVTKYTNARIKTDFNHKFDTKNLLHFARVICNGSMELWNYLQQNSRIKILHV